MPSTKKETVHQFARFFLVGLSNTAIDFGVYLSLTRFIPFFGSYIYLANTIAFAAAATWSYVANRTWTFKVTTKANPQEATKFYISTITAFILSTLTLYTFVELFQNHDVLGKVAASAVSMVWNFSLNKLWVFNNKK
jgi:putative flippase GtrA